VNPTTDLIDHRSRPRTTSGPSGRFADDPAHRPADDPAHRPADDPAHRPGSGITAELDREWRRLRHDRRTLHILRTWVDRGLVRADGALAARLRDLRDLDDLVAATQRHDHRRRMGGDVSGTGGVAHCHPGSENEILLELVALARGEQIAGRILLQRILPGLLARSRRYVASRIRHELADIAVAAAWVAIHAYDHERRPRQVAAALISDAVFTAFRQPHRRRASTEQLRPHEAWARRPAAESPTTPIVELAGVLAEARRCGVERQHLDLLRGLARTGSATAVAAELSVTDRTVRTRRDRAIAQVREAIVGG
jgi:hypothetical protein